MSTSSSSSSSSSSTSSYSSSYSFDTRDIYSSPPPAELSFLQKNPTILMCWWCTAMSICIIFIRVTGRYLRTSRFFTEDKIISASIIPLVARAILVHYTLAWGTNNVNTDGLSASDINDREKGSQVVLAARITFAIYIWMTKWTVCQFVRRLTNMVWTKSFQRAIRFMEYLLAVTLVVVIIATLTECRPFNHYWQVVPDPGPHCRLGYANLLAMGVCDILTDALLVLLPATVFLASAMSIKRKIKLTILFASSFILVGITSYRVTAVIRHDGQQSFRSLMASFEILAATSISNFLVIGSFIRDRGLKKAKYNQFKRAQGSLSAIDSVDSTSVRRATITKNHWGSDADLAGGLGIRLDPDLYAMQLNGIRPAPVAQGAFEPDSKYRPDTDSMEDHSSRPSNVEEILPVQFVDINEPVMSRASPPGMSFYDIGGLLDDSDLTPRQHMKNFDIPPHETEMQGTSYRPAPPSSIHFQVPVYTNPEDHLEEIGLAFIPPQRDPSEATDRNHPENDGSEV